MYTDNKNTSYFTTFSLVSVCIIVDAKRGCETVLNKLVLLVTAISIERNLINRVQKSDNMTEGQVFVGPL